MLSRIKFGDDSASFLSLRAERSLRSEQAASAVALHLGSANKPIKLASVNFIAETDSGRNLRGNEKTIKIDF